MGLDVSMFRSFLELLLIIPGAAQGWTGMALEVELSNVLPYADSANSRRQNAPFVAINQCSPSIAECGSKEGR